MIEITVNKIKKEFEYYEEAAKFIVNNLQKSENKSFSTRNFQLYKSLHNELKSQDIEYIYETGRVYRFELINEKEDDFSNQKLSEVETRNKLYEIIDNCEDLIKDSKLNNMEPWFIISNLKQIRETVNGILTIIEIENEEI